MEQLLKEAWPTYAAARCSLRDRSEAIAHPRIHESPVHPERGIDRIEKHAGAAHLCGTGRSAGPEVSVGKRIEQILRSVRAAIKIPFTLKFRAGWCDQELVTVRMARLAEDCRQRVATVSQSRHSGRKDPPRW